MECKLPLSLFKSKQTELSYVSVCLIRHHSVSMCFFFSSPSKKVAELNVSMTLEDYGPVREQRFLLPDQKRNVSFNASISGILL